VAKLRKTRRTCCRPAGGGGHETDPDATVMQNSQMRTNEQSLVGITVISVPAYNVQRGPSPGQYYHPRGRGQGYVLAFSDKLADVRQLKAAQVYVRRRYGMRPCDVHMGEGRQRGADADEPAVHDDAGGSGGLREGVQAEGGHPYHYMGQNPQEFADALKGSGIEVRLFELVSEVLGKGTRGLGD
jgi:hypothetical protein